MGKRIRAFLLGFSMLLSVLNPSVVYAENVPADEAPNPVDFCVFPVYYADDRLVLRKKYCGNVYCVSKNYTVDSSFTSRFYRRQNAD